MRDRRGRAAERDAAHSRSGRGRHRGSRRRANRPDGRVARLALAGAAARRDRGSADAALHELLRRAGEFGVNVLAEGQEHLAQHFARGVPPIALWQGIPSAKPTARRCSRARSPGCGAASRTSTRRATTRSSSAKSPKRSRAGPSARSSTSTGGTYPRDRRRCLRPRRAPIETEEIWDEVREALARERGGRWTESAQRDMMGMSSTEWSRYMHEAVGLAEAPEEINHLVVERMAGEVPVTAPTAPRRRRGGGADRGPLAARRGLVVEPGLIDLVLELPGSRRSFGRRSRPRRSPAGSPRRTSTSKPLGVSASTPRVRPRSRTPTRDPVGVGRWDARRRHPQPLLPPGDEALGLADVVLDSLADLTPAAVEGWLTGGGGRRGTPAGDRGGGRKKKGGGGGEGGGGEGGGGGRREEEGRGGGGGAEGGGRGGETGGGRRGGGEETERGDTGGGGGQRTARGKKAARGTPGEGGGKGGEGRREKGGGGGGGERGGGGGGGWRGRERGRRRNLRGREER